MIMNNYDSEGNRHRKRTLIIVEGNHEKEQLITRITECFPEIPINMNDVYIYRTNIYVLYEKIVDEYGEDWDSDEIDLIFMITKNTNQQLDNTLFTNTLLVFDYERHDPNFSEEKIVKLQGYFSKIAEFGQLYINYPMIESYLDFTDIPDTTFLSKKCDTKISLGSEYKVKVANNSLTKLMKFPKDLSDVLNKNYSFLDKLECEKCMHEILELKNCDKLEIELDNIFSKYLLGGEKNRAKKHIRNRLLNMKYIEIDENYYLYLRKQLIYIIKENILKADMIQNNRTAVNNQYDYGDLLDFNKILIEQNKLCNSNSGYIWVLNTFITFIAEFDSNLLST